MKYDMHFAICFAAFIMLYPWAYAGSVGLSELEEKEA